MSQSWLQKEGGLRFKCTQCGNCCASSSGIVLVNEQDCQRLANRVRMNLEDFKRQCTWSYDGDMRTLKTTAQGCILFDPYKRLCTVYGDHPTQCKTYPFWLGTTKTQEAWEETCKKCPGAGTAQGNFYPADRVRMLAVGTMMKLNAE